MTDGRANATINREVELLKRSFRLAQKEGRINRVPYIPMLREQNTRQGFFEADEFAAVLLTLPKPVADAASFAYRTGWRKGEVVSLRWEQVDRSAREVRLPITKNGRPRSLPLVGDLWDLIERRWQAREYHTATGAVGLSAFVFHGENGKSLGDFRKSWITACKAAGVPGKLFHDFRRTAARNLIRSGVSETVAMSITGHVTRSMFDRYNVTNESDKREALTKTEARLNLINTEAKSNLLTFADGDRTGTN